MGQVLVTESNLTNIANAIRAKNGGSDTYTPTEMAAAISAIGGTVAWWGGFDPVFLYEANYTQTLSNMDYADKTPSTSAQSMTYPATTYTTSRNANPTFDRWGSSYHSGSALNFALYDYFVLQDIMVNIAYTSTESSLGVAHSTEHQIVAFQFIGQRFRVSNGNVISPSSTTYGTTTAITVNFPNTFYRNASNTLLVGTSAGYGIYPSSVAPSFQSTSNLKSTYINFRAPTWSIRTNTTYMAAGAWTYVNPNNTTIKNRQRLYQVRKPDAFENVYSRMEYMHANNAFPTEEI